MDEERAPGPTVSLGSRAIGALSLVVMGLVIGANNFSAALSLGALGQASRRLRITAVFAAFEFVVPLVGAAAGQAMAVTLASGARWISAALLLGVGLVTLRAGVRPDDQDERRAELVTTWRGLAVLAAGLSADNLAVGFGLGLGQVSPLLLAGTITAFSTVFTWIGLTVGDQMRRHWEQRAQVVAGVAMIGLALAGAAGWL